MTSTLANQRRPLDARQFEIAVRRLADSLNHGSDISSYLGAGIDYAQSRPFCDGDDVRAIDWKVTARTRRFHVKEYETLKRMPIQLVADTSASMRASSVALSKYELMAQLAGGLALAGLGRASPVGLIGGGGQDMRYAPSMSQATVFMWLHRLRTMEVEPGETTKLAARLRELGEMLPCRTLVMVLSDLHDLDAVPALKRLALAHDLVVLKLVDPAERGRLRAGFIDAREAETGAARMAHGRSRWHDPGAAGRALAGAGIDHLELATDRPFMAKVRGFLRERDRARGTR